MTSLCLITLPQPYLTTVSLFKECINISPKKKKKYQLQNTNLCHGAVMRLRFMLYHIHPIDIN